MYSSKEYMETAGTMQLFAGMYHFQHTAVPPPCYVNLHKHVTRALESFLYACKCCASANSSCPSPSSVTACNDVRYGVAMTVVGFCQYFDICTAV